MKLVVGLGNPGEKYFGTRHNLGFMLLDEFAQKILGGPATWLNELKFNSQTLRLSKDLLLAKPQTYMNNSGEAVKKLTGYFKIKPEDIIVIHDDLDLPLGKIKIRRGGSGGGHHGVESVINFLGSDQFIRVRLGIGNLTSLSSEHLGQSFAAEKFVLEPFLPNEHSKLKQMLKRTSSALNLLLKEGLEIAQNQIN